MRQERDSLGEVLIAAETYYGIGTARLVEALPTSGQKFPPKIIEALIQIRRAQIMTARNTEAWSEVLCASILGAAEKLLGDNGLREEQICNNPLYCGGVRGVLENVDEVLANLALVLLGLEKGEYHRLAPFFQLNLEKDAAAIYMAAVHISLLEALTALDSAAKNFSKILRATAARWEKVLHVKKRQGRDIEISPLGDFFAQFDECVQRHRLQFDWLKSRLLPCWSGKPETLMPLRQLTGLELAVCQNKFDFPDSLDLYLNLASQLKSIAMLMLRFCAAMGEMTGSGRALESSRLRSGQDFNPAECDMLALDAVSQTMFFIIGGEAAISAAASAGGNGATAYMPFYTANLWRCVRWAEEGLLLLTEKFMDALACNEENVQKAVEATPLQAEKLIPVIGYDRAVQVARIAALTGKTVPTVIVKMKLMSEAAAAATFAPIDEASDSEEG